MQFLVHHFISQSVQRFPEKEALVYGNQRLSYGEVKKSTVSLGNALAALGIVKGDRVGVYVDPGIEQTLAIFGVSNGGAAFVPINQLLFPEQVKHIVNDCGIKALFVDSDKFESLCPHYKDMPSLKFLIHLDDEVPKTSSLPVYSFSELLRCESSGERDRGVIERDLAAILYTSGSTGKPKGVMLNHAQVMAGSSIVSEYLKISAKDRILAILPFSFDAGLNQVMTAFQQGGTCIIKAFIFAREIVTTIVKENVTGLAGVPTLWSLIVQPSSTLSKKPCPSLRYITNTGGAMPQNVLKELRKTLPNTSIYLMYGLTEAFRSTYLPPEELDRRPTSMGKAIPNTDIMVINDDGKLCKPGEIGELVHRGPTISLGYWGKPDITARVIRPHPLLSEELGESECVCYSGDLVKKDEDGFLYFIGRKDNTIKSSGFRVSPNEVEEVIYRSGKIREVGVVGVPDELLGQAIHAFVVLNDGETIDSDWLKEFCVGNMPRHMMPAVITFVTNLPKTPSSKIDYPALRNMAKSR